MTSWLYYLARYLAPPLASPLYLPFFIPSDQFNDVAGRFLTLWGLLILWGVATYFLFRITVRTLQDQGSGALSRAGKFADLVALLLCGFLTLGSLEVLRARTSSVALAVVLLALAGDGIARAIPLRFRNPWVALPGRAAGYFVSMTAIGSLTDYFISDHWNWEPVVLFAGASALLTIGWIAGQLPTLATHPAVKDPIFRRRLVRGIHLGAALGPTLVMGLTANHALPRAYLLLLFLIYFLQRPYLVLSKFEDSGELDPGLPRQLQAGAVLFLAMLVLLRLIAL